MLLAHDIFYVLTYCLVLLWTTIIHHEYVLVQGVFNLMQINLILIDPMLKLKRIALWSLREPLAMANLN